MSVGPVNNPIGLHNLYPGAPGSSVAQAGSESNPGNTEDMGSSVAIHPIEANFASMLGTNPVWAWIGLVVLLFAGMFLATRFRGSTTAANLRFSLYNVIAVVTLGIVGGAIAKVAAAKWKLPFGISTIILAS